jgi:16S rRNA (guanine966-N2)-methyltransferase
VRVIAGEARGTRLGPVPKGVRPVSDRAREGLFSSLGGRIPGARVLDLFAGTGSLGIEALSRGALRATFVDRNRASAEAIRDNLRRARLEDRAEVKATDALRMLTRDDNPRPSYDLVVLDPPYEHDLPEVEAVLRALDDGWLAEGWTVVLTRATRSSTLVIPVHWAIAKRLEYGDTTVLILEADSSHS